MVWRIGFCIVVMFGLSACASVNSYQSSVTSFSQGVLALKGINDAMSSSLSGLSESQQDAAWTSNRTKLQVLAACRQAPNNADAHALAPCAIAEQGQTDTSPSSIQQGLETAKEYLDALNKYTIALAALSGSTDQDAASKSEQSIVSSLGGIATTVGTVTPGNKAKAQAGISAIGALGTAVSFFISERRNKVVAIAVEAANPAVGDISKFVAIAFQNAQQKLISKLNNDINNQKKFHIIDPSLMSPLDAKVYATELASLRQSVAHVNVARSYDAIAAAKALADAHAALNTALQGGGDPSSVSQAMAKFLNTTQKALTAFQQLSNDVSGKQSSNKGAN